MGRKPIGVAVIGAGIAGRAHASGYRLAPALYGDGVGTGGTAGTGGART